MILLRSIVGFYICMQRVLAGSPTYEKGMQDGKDDRLRGWFYMRINEPNRTGMINAYNKTGATPVSKSGKISMGKDEVKISTEAMEMLKQVEDPNAPARREKVEQLRKQIEEGTYHVPSEKIADKFLSFWKKL